MAGYVAGHVRARLCAASGFAASTYLTNTPGHVAGHVAGHVPGTCVPACMSLGYSTTPRPTGLL